MPDSPSSLKIGGYFKSDPSHNFTMLKLTNLPAQFSPSAPHVVMNKMLKDFMESGLLRTVQSDHEYAPLDSPNRNVFTSMGLDSSMVRTLEIGMMALNSMDFCLVPKIQTFSTPFFERYFLQYGINTAVINPLLESAHYFESVYRRLPQPRIPLKTHRMWVTDPYTGTEILDAVHNESFFAEMLATNRLLDDSEHKWTHYLWVNEKKAIPRSVKWFEDHGFIVKELRQLHTYDAQLDIIIKDMQSERFGAGADIARFAVLYEEGGFYLDHDLFLRQWDNQVLHYFDSIRWKNDLGFPYWTMNTYGFLIKPYHPELKYYMDTFKQHFFQPETTFHLQACLDRSQAITLYETGPFFFTAAYLKHA